MSSMLFFLKSTANRVDLVSVVRDADKTRTKVIWQRAESLCQLHPTANSPGGSIRLSVCLQFPMSCFGWGAAPVSHSLGG